MATTTIGRRLLRLVGWIFALLLVLVTGVVLYFSFVFDWNKSRVFASGQLSRVLGRESGIDGDLIIHPDWPLLRIEANEVHIANMEHGSAPQMLQAKKLTVVINLLSLLKGQMVLPELALDTPTLLLERDKDGYANWNLLDNPAGAAATAPVPEDRTEMPIIGQLTINQGSLTYNDAVANVFTTLKLNSLEGNAKRHEALQVEGTGKYNGRPFKLKAEGGSVLMLRENEDPYPLQADVTIGNTNAVINGTLEDPFALKGMELSLKLKGQDAAELFPIIGIALPNTPPYNVTGKLGFDKEKKLWSFHEFKGRMGDSDLAGDLDWNMAGERPLLTARFVSEKLDMDDLAGFIGATPSTAPGETASRQQKADAAKKEESPFILPDATLDIERVSSMDADVTLNGKKLLSDGLPMDDFKLKVLLKDRILKLDPVQFGTASGDIIAYITINAQTQPVKTTSDVTFKKLDMARIFAPASKELGIKNEAQGYIGGRAQLEGTGDSVRKMLANAQGKVGIAMEGGQLSNLIVELIGLDIAESFGFFLTGDKPVPVRCIVGDFAVTGGMMNTQTFVIDTADTNIKGTGTVDLKSEKLDFTLKPHPKDPSILTVRSPIRVTGTLKNPDIGVSTGNLIARGGAAAALAIAVPVAGLLAFLEPGMGKDSNCAQLLKQDAAVEKPDTVKQKAVK